MRRFILTLAAALVLLAGCGSSGAPDIPAGLTWRAQTLADSETGETLASWEGWTGLEDIPLLDVTAQVEDGTVILTDQTTGETCTGTLGPDQDDTAKGVVCSLSFSGGVQGYATYGVTEYLDGSRDATLYLVAEGRTLYLTAPLPDEGASD